jgi:hypothetical protein
MRKSDSPWDEETTEMIKKSQMRSELGLDEDNIRINKPKKASAKSVSAQKRKTALPKNAAKRKAIQQILKTGLIPASPTR